MSRGFVKEGDQEEPVIIPQRAILPEGVVNYVTPVGKVQLLEELKQLEHDLHQTSNFNEVDQRRAKTLIHGKIKLLKERIASARVIEPKGQKQDEVRFGATVFYQLDNNPRPFTITIVGVDEANTNIGKIAFTTPIAKNMAGAQVGDTISFQLGDEQKMIKIRSIAY